MFKKIVSVFATAVFLLMVSVNAAADKPYLERGYEEGIDYPFFVCDGFEIWGIFDVTWWDTYFTDRDGNLVKHTYHQRILNTVFYNTENPEITHEARSDVAFVEWSYDEDGNEVEYRERGVFWHLMDGGEKIIFISGIGIWNPDDGYFHHGVFNYPTDDEAMARVCSFFAE